MQLIEQILMVFAVLAILVLSLLFLRRKGYAHFAVGQGSASHKRLEVIERVSLTPQHSLHLVRLANRLLLVGLSPSGCRLLESADFHSLDPTWQGPGQKG